MTRPTVVRQNAAVFDEEGETLTDGLEPSYRSNQAARVAGELSRERGLVYLLDSDGGWEVQDGEFARIDDPEHWIYSGETLKDAGGAE